MKPALLQILLNSNIAFDRWFVNTYAPELYREFREVGGATPVNLGSAVLTIAQSNVTQGQVGAQGRANDAHSWNGTTSYEQITTDAAIITNTFSWGFLVKANTVGEANAGRFYQAGAERYLRFSTTMATLNSQINSGGAAVTTTTTGLTAGEGTWVFKTYDNAGDRKIHLYKGLWVAGIPTVTEYAYSAQTAATGTITAVSGNTFIGNNSAAAATTFDGLFDVVFRKSAILTTADMLAIVTRRNPAFL